MAVGDSHVFPGFLTPGLTQLFFPKSPTTLLICICRGERRKYAGKKVHLNRGSNSQPPGHESDTLKNKILKKLGQKQNFENDILDKFHNTWSSNDVHENAIFCQG